MYVSLNFPGRKGTNGGNRHISPLVSYFYRLAIILQGPADPISRLEKSKLIAKRPQVEDLINDHIAHQKDGTHSRSKLKLLVPSVGVFFTPLLLQEAFEYQDRQRRISSRRFVPPSFNDIRLILNSAQILSLVRGGPLQLVTFDGDVTLYGMHVTGLVSYRPVSSLWIDNGPCATLCSLSESTLLGVRAVSR